MRKHGNAPFDIAVIHGGPGAAGEMAPVARELAAEFGVLEPMQTAHSVDGQIEELRTQLETTAQLRCTLAGFSWGAWLSLLVATKFPSLVKKLILIGCPPCDEEYAAQIHETRLRRLSPEDRAEMDRLMQRLQNSHEPDKDTVFTRLGVLMSKADAFDPIEKETGADDCRFSVFESVWKEAAELRRSGQLMEMASRVQCPVFAIHGGYDPHPAEGVEKPFEAGLDNFRFIVLQKCGHKPWIERQAKDEFVRILEGELHSTD